MVVLHIKLKRNTNAATQKQIFCHRPSPPNPQPTLVMGTIGQNSPLKFSKHCRFAYHIKGNQDMQQHGSTYFALRPPHLPP